MKIIHFTSGDITGGAARGAYFLHQAIKNQGINSRIFITDPIVDEGFKDIEYLSQDINKKQEKLRSKRLDEFILSHYPNRKDNIFSLGNGVYDSEVLELSKEADIIHFHWMNSQMINLELLNKIDKPVVWTFRDMWPFTGGCHYSQGCQKYKTGCEACGILGSNEKDDISKLTYSGKQDTYSRLYPVAISNWIQECASSSKLFQEKYIHMIPNCIDVNEFQPYAKDIVRKEFDLPLNKKIILFGAVNAYADYRKGFTLLVEALKNIENKEEYHLITFGGKDSNMLRDMSFTYTEFGKINSDDHLSKIYSAAHVFVAPSIEEAFGKTIVEAMSCGTPVVAFNATGPKDIVKHGSTGYLCDAYNPSDMTEGIEFVVNHPHYEELSTTSRAIAEENYSLDVVATQYVELYKKILDSEISNPISKVQRNKTDIYSDRNGYMEKFKLFLETEWNSKNYWYIFEDKVHELLDKISNRKVAIYGTGSFGKEVLSILIANGIKVDVLIDGNKSLHGEIIHSLEVVPLNKCTNHFVFIASTWFEDIEQTLNNKNFKKSDYVTCKK
ncbi:glycosyl transferase [Sporosarcina newyorkensis 2681]|uniref:Glycosyl transferase n=1 Tax=Sporosarcina newyorkensis 2681 TaxID=1027292 RepID=F9DQ80_9BACL|nr:glycosyltransferase family 4 protein [Sporosarcina newyorkensis]EGQ27038.1 glycosyl transferase [Sporosarcina newyorkensis 2681]